MGFFQNENCCSKPDNPTLLVPVSNNPTVEQHRLKDRAMAAIATQFIGKPANPNIPTTTADYEKNWGNYSLANTGNYTADDVIMVSGNVPRKGKISLTQVQSTFEQHY